jgi:hypothetical protein
LPNCCESVRPTGAFRAYGAAITEENTIYEQVEECRAAGRGVESERAQIDKFVGI